MSWLQLRIVTDRKRVPESETKLEHAGALSITLEDNADQPIFEPGIGETPLWENTRVTGLFPADVDTQAISSNIISALALDDSQLHWHVLEDKDWEREWMSNYHPIRCAENLWICPSWLDQPDPSAVNLILDPGLAFGTGTHPTTFLCLQWLADQELQNRFVIDYGCGSGILGVAALLLGATKVQGVDIDPQALIATQENTKRNNIHNDRFPVYFPQNAPADNADMVLANILAGPLVELADTLLARLNRGGKLCLSGVLATQKDKIVAAYEYAIEFDSHVEKEGWICLTGTKQ